MKSTTGIYYVNIDKLRGFAALLVFTWHFIHVNNLHEKGPISIPFNIFTEGHTGVALFMVLSGYLFAKLLQNKKIIYTRFIFNRVIRLLPLLLFFYLILPFLLLLNNRKLGLWMILVSAILFRIFLFYQTGKIYYLSYWTIIGRIDQFIFGILAFSYSSLIKQHSKLVFLGIVLFLLCYYLFDYYGGHQITKDDPVFQALWILIPTIEGMAYALLVAWYDLRTPRTETWISRLFTAAGKYSYSIYLLHFFLVFRLGNFIDQYLVKLENIYLTLLCSTIAFVLMIPIGYLSFEYLEKPFLTYRKQYFK